MPSIPAQKKPDARAGVIFTVDSEAIYKKACATVRRYGTRDTVQIAREMNIKLMYSGELESLLGMYTCLWKHRIIILNNKLDGPMLRLVVGHELGHDAFHRELARNEGLKEFVLFNMKDDTEYVANAFAAHLLLDDDEVYSLAKSGCDIVQLAAGLETDINLALIKLQEMNRLGWDFRLPAAADGRFLAGKNAEGTL